MRSRKKTRQTAQTAARGENATAPDVGVDNGADAGGASPETGTSPVAASAPAAGALPSAAPSPIVQAEQISAFEDNTGLESFDAAVEGPEAQVSEGAEEDLDPKAMFAMLRQRVLDNPSDFKSRVRLGRVHDQRSEPLLALEQYQAAVAASDDNSDVVLQYAQALTNLNRFAEAERELRRVLRTEPENGHLHLQLGTISFRRGLYSQAEVELKRAIDLLPDAAMAYFHRGESLNQLSRIDEALDMLERGVALDPNYSRAYYIMGILYDRKGRPQEAGVMYKKAREVSGT